MSAFHLKPPYTFLRYHDLPGIDHRGSIARLGSAVAAAFAQVAAGPALSGRRSLLVD